MVLGWLEFAFIDKKENTSHPCTPAVTGLKANIPFCYASQFNDCKLRNHGTNRCNQYNAIFSLKLYFPSNEISSFFGDLRAEFHIQFLVKMRVLRMNEIKGSKRYFKML